MIIGIYSLSNELLALILDHAPDLPTLHTLICTQRIWLSLFELKPIELIEAVIKISLPPEIQKFPRWIAIITSLSSPNSIYNLHCGPDPSLEQFTRSYDTVHYGTDPFYVLELSPQFRWTPAPREVLAAASRIQRLEDICLVALLQNITGMQLSYPRERSFEFDPHTAPVQLADEVSFTPTANWAPSWIERQRVRLALWQQTVCWYNHRAFLSEENPIVDLREGGMRLVFNHTADEYSGLLMGEWLWPAVRGDVFDSVNHVLYSILGHSPLLFFSGILYSDVVDAEIEARDKLGAAHEYTKQIIRSKSEWLMSDSKPTTNNNSKEDFLLGQGTQDFSQHNFAMGFFVSQYVQSDVGKTLEAKDFRCASLLGLSVWDTPRLCALGLAPPPPPSNSRTTAASPIPPQTLTGYLYVWRSVLIHELSRMASMWPCPLGTCGLTLPKGTASLLSLSQHGRPVFVEPGEEDGTKVGEHDAETIQAYGIDSDHRTPTDIELEEMDIHKEIVEATEDLLRVTTKINLKRLGLDVGDIKVDEMEMEMDKRNAHGSKAVDLLSDIEMLEDQLLDLRQERAQISRESRDVRY